MPLRDLDSYLPHLIVGASLLLAIPACLPKDSSDGDSGGGGGWFGRGGDIGEVSVSSPEVSDGSWEEDDDFSAGDISLEITSSGVSLSIWNAPTDLSFGIVEGCGDGDCWEAESCVASTDGYAFCHDVGTSGAFLSKVDSPDSVSSGSTTLFSSDTTGPLGFFLDAGGECWVWGDYSEFYDGYGCENW